MTEYMNEQIDKWMNEKIIKGKVNACLERIMNKQINEWINEWMKNEKNGYMDEWMIVGTDERISKCGE